MSEKFSVLCNVLNEFGKGKLTVKQQKEAAPSGDVIMMLARVSAQD